VDIQINLEEIALKREGSKTDRAKTQILSNFNVIVEDIKVEVKRQFYEITNNKLIDEFAKLKLYNQLEVANKKAIAEMQTIKNGATITTGQPPKQPQKQPYRTIGNDIIAAQQNKGLI